MATEIRAGDRVRITDRPATAQDHRTGLYYDHYRGLSGAVQKVFEGREAAVELDLDTLPEAIWKRHMNVRDQMRHRWLEGLSDDQRRRLTPEETDFNLRYVVLVSVADLEKQRARRRARA